jgi:DNA-binding LytR/AlgR family response regulator
MPYPDTPARALIADDEDLPRAELRRMLGQAWPALQIVAECEDGHGSLEALAEHQPDIAFLDIRMPGASGLQVAQAALAQAEGGTPCQVVFTTAYDSHAVAAFEAGAVDYLLKPVSAERLAQTVQRLQARLASRVAAPATATDPAASQAALQHLLAQLGAQLTGERVPRLRWVSASVGETIKLFGIDEILFFQSDEKYTRVVTAHDEAHVRKPLRELLDGLDPEEFWQVHRGTVVRASAIARAQRDELGRITLQLRQHAERLAVSQAWAWRFKPM